ncbi:MAG: hypothetical protein ACT4QE_08730 [Anaerolineales bacterium]
MLRQLINVLTTGVLVSACAQAMPTATPSRIESTSTSIPPIPITFPTAIPEETPLPIPTAQSLFPKVSANDWQKGPATARVTIIEYGDFQ